DGVSVDGYITSLGSPIVSRWVAANADSSGNFINGSYVIAGGPYSFFGDAPSTSYGKFERSEATGESLFTLKAKGQGLGDGELAKIEGKINDTTGQSYLNFDVSGSSGEQK